MKRLNSKQKEKSCIIINYVRPQPTYLPIKLSMYLVWPTHLGWLMYLPTEIPTYINRDLV